MSFSDADADFQRLIETNQTGVARRQAFQQLANAVAQERNARIEQRRQIMMDYIDYIPRNQTQPTNVPNETPEQTMRINAREQRGGGDMYEVDIANRLRERENQKIVQMNNYKRRMLDLVHYNRHLFYNLPPPSVGATLAPPPLPF
jgi:hypothetical protein